MRGPGVGASGAWPIRFGVVGTERERIAEDEGVVGRAGGCKSIANESRSIITAFVPEGLPRASKWRLAA